MSSRIPKTVDKVGTIINAIYGRYECVFVVAVKYWRSNFGVLHVITNGSSAYKTKLNLV